MQMINLQDALFVRNFSIMQKKCGQKIRILLYNVPASLVQATYFYRAQYSDGKTLERKNSFNKQRGSEM